MLALDLVPSIFPIFSDLDDLVADPAGDLGEEGVRTFPMGFLVLAFGLDHGLQDLGIAHRLVAGLLPVTPAFQAQERLLVAPLDELSLIHI